LAHHRRGVGNFSFSLRRYWPVSTMASGLRGTVPHHQTHRIRLLRCLALVALLAVLQAWLTRRRTPAFTFGAGCENPSLRGSSTPASRSARPAGEGASGGKAAGVIPVVDDSDFAGDPEPKKPSESRKKKVEDFDSLLKAADRYSTKADRQKRKSRSSALALDDDLKGMSLEDDAGLEIDLMSRARTGKTDVSLNGRLAKWARETQELVRNPTPVQVTFGVIFGASCLFVVLIFVLTYSMGAVRLRGDDLQVERRRQMEMNDPYIQRYQRMMEFKKSAMEVEDLRMLNRDGSIKEEFKNKETGKPLNPSGENFGTKSLRLFGAPPPLDEEEELVLGKAPVPRDVDPNPEPKRQEAPQEVVPKQEPKPQQ